MEKSEAFPRLRLSAQSWSPVPSWVGAAPLWPDTCPLFVARSSIATNRTKRQKQSQRQQRRGSAPTTPLGRQRTSPQTPQTFLYAEATEPHLSTIPCPPAISLHRHDHGSHIARVARATKKLRLYQPCLDTPRPSHPQAPHKTPPAAISRST